MNVLEIVFLTIGMIVTIIWTFGCWQKYNYSADLNIATANSTWMFWVSLILAFFKFFNPIHLIWIFPVIMGFAYIYITLHIRFKYIVWPFTFITKIFIKLISFIPVKNGRLLIHSKKIAGELIDIATRRMTDLNERESELEDYEKQEIVISLPYDIAKEYDELKGYNEGIDVITSNIYNLLNNDGAQIRFGDVIKYYVIESYNENDFIPTKSENKTIDITISMMFEGWKDNMNIAFG